MNDIKPFEQRAVPDVGRDRNVRLRVVDFPFLKRHLGVVAFALACASPDERPVDSSIEVHRVALPAQNQKADSTTRTDDLLEGEGWWVGRDDPATGERHRFLAEFMSYNSGVAYIRLDSIVRQAGIVDSFTKVDSLTFRFNARIERVSNHCRPWTAPGPIVGIVPGTTPDARLRATTAWVIDTIALRIRPIPADSVTCTVLHGE